MAFNPLSRLPFLPDRSPRTPVEGKVVLITGGGAGIGAATARDLAARGARLVLTDVDSEALESTCQQITAEHGADIVIGVEADVCDFAQMEGAVQQATSRYGGVDVVLANAGISSYGSAAVVDPAMFRKVVEVNLVGVFNTVKAALPSLVEREGYALLVSSLSSFLPAPGMTAYTASKAGVENLAHSLRMELAHQGVAVGCAHMSWIDTPLVREVRSDLSAFEETLRSYPPPMNHVSDVQVCVDAFVEAVERRSRVVHVPGWVGGIGGAREMFRRISEGQTLKRVPALLTRMDEEVRAMGRTASRRTTEHNADPARATPSAR